MKITNSVIPNYNQRPAFKSRLDKSQLARLLVTDIKQTDKLNGITTFTPEVSGVVEINPSDGYANSYTFEPADGKPRKGTLSATCSGEEIIEAVQRAEVMRRLNQAGVPGIVVNSTIGRSPELLLDQIGGSLQWKFTPGYEKNNASYYIQGLRCTELLDGSIVTINTDSTSGGSASLTTTDIQVERGGNRSVIDFQETPYTDRLENIGKNAFYQGFLNQR